MLAIMLGKCFPIFNNLGIVSALISFIMCMISKYQIFSYCPGIFVGCFTTFAAGGSLKMILPSLIIGAFLGVSCEYSGKWLFEKTLKTTSAEN